MSHDFTAQRTETYAVFAGIQSDADLPDTADLDYMFTPNADADWEGFEKALDTAGYDCEREVDEADGAYIVAILADQPISALTIWMGEEMATKIALQFGFSPDGWGFTA